MPDADVLVVGAGMAGLTAARRLTDAGLAVTVLDKGRGVGGRLATRRVGQATIDHGAQFFTVRSDWFAGVLRDWLDAGIAVEWCRGFRDPPDGHPRYVGTTGMTALAKHLATGLDVRTGTRVGAVSGTDDGWAMTLDDRAEPLRARAAVLTAPVPQTLELLAAGGTALEPTATAALGAVRYDPTLAALVVTDGPTAVPPPGGVQLADGLLSWVGDNRAKGISARPALTLHATGSVSAARWDEPADETLAVLLDAGAPYLGGAPVAAAQLMRWHYAQPVASHPERHLVAVDGDAPLVCAGDAFGEAKVEGAARSGWEAAGAVLERLGG